MSAAPNLTEILDRQWSLLIGGRLTPAISGRYYDDESPVTEEVIAAVPHAGVADVEAAVQAQVQRRWPGGGWRPATAAPSWLSWQMCWNVTPRSWHCWTR